MWVLLYSAWPQLWLLVLFFSDQYQVAPEVCCRSRVRVETGCTCVCVCVHVCVERGMRVHMLLLHGCVLASY